MTPPRRLGSRHTTRGNVMKLTRLLALALVLGFTACNHARVNTVETYYGPPMPRPDHVYVANFSVTPEEVRLDQGIGARISRIAEDQPPGAGEMKAARDTQAALSRNLVQRLREYGLPAEYA